MTGYVVHDQEVTPDLGEKVGDLGKARMVKSGQDARFAVELLVGLSLRVFVRQGIGLHLFDSAQAPVEAHILSLVNAAHAAPADHLADFISFA
jgi:hypothetical protein